MQTVIATSRVALAQAMTYRVYVRWPQQRTSEKTSTESHFVAETAFTELTRRANELRGKGALGVTWTLNGQKVSYHQLNEEPADTPRRRDHGA